jgi:signal transduction histidine kinase
VAVAEALLIGGRSHPIKQRLVFRAADGTSVPVQVSATLLEQPDQRTLCLLATDLTEVERSIDLVQRLRRHEEALREREEQLFEAHERLEALMDALPVGVSFSRDASCRDVTGNAAVLAQLDAGPGDNLSPSAPDENAPGRRVRFFQQGRQLDVSELPLQRAVAENRTIPPMELEVVMPSGRRWYAHASGAPIRDFGGNAVGGVSVTVDITSRKEAEEALRLANLKLEKKIQEGTAALAERATQLRALAAELTLSEQRERRRMAKVVHDHLQQLLAGAKFRATLLGRRTDPRARQAVGELEELLDSALDASRALTVELSPPILHDGNLADGLEWLSRWMADRHGLVVVLSEMPGCRRWPRTSRSSSSSRSASCCSTQSSTRTCGRRRSTSGRSRRRPQVIVTDSGRGFDPAKLKGAGEAGGGFRLFSIRERLGLVGGRMDVHSVPGRTGHARYRSARPRC